ncbi:MAG: PfkB family carbohydrate kinase [Hafnia sp.]
MILKEERQKKIISILNNDGFVKVTQLAAQLSVTKETIRADLNFLAKKGILTRCHGGAFLEFSSLEKLAIKEMIQYLECVDSSKKTSDEYMTTSKICVLGSFNVDMISYLPRLPVAGESLLANKFIFSPGGKGANQALAASFSNSQVHFITKIGHDQFSDFALNYISSSKITSSCIYRTDGNQTGTASIFVSEDNGDNMISIFPGANMDITKDEVRLQTDKIINSSVILIQLETNIEALREIISIGTSHNIPIILNPAPYNEVALSIMKDIYLLTPNETEASLISGVTITDIESAKKAAMLIHQLGVQKVVITLGKNGAIAYDGKECIHSPAYLSIVKNTAGAGDAFNGALSASLARGESLKYALQYASAFASLAVETENASDMPEHTKVMARIRQSRYAQSYI